MAAIWVSGRSQSWRKSVRRLGRARKRHTSIHDEPEGLSDAAMASGATRAKVPLPDPAGLVLVPALVPPLGVGRVPGRVASESGGRRDLRALAGSQRRPHEAGTRKSSIWYLAHPQDGGGARRRKMGARKHEVRERKERKKGRENGKRRRGERKERKRKGNKMGGGRGKKKIRGSEEGREEV